MRRRLGPAVLALVVLAACGDDDTGSASTTIVGAGTTVGATDATTSTTAPGSSGGTGGSVGASGTTGGAATATTAPAPGRLDPGGVGGLAAPLLRPGHGNRIVVEVRAQSGAEPRTATLDALLGMLRRESGKTVVMDGVDPLAGAARQWTSGSIARTADGEADYGQGGTQVVLRLLFVHGSFDGDDSVLGVSVRGDVAAVFTDQVDGAAGLLTSAAVVEDAVTVHEAGHLLGLVDLAIDTGRDDPDHPGHSTNQDSVMYWAVESDLIGQVLGGGVPTDFDTQDRADLARIRAGA